MTKPQVISFKDFRKYNKVTAGFSPANTQLYLIAEANLNDMFQRKKY